MSIICPTLGTASRTEEMKLGSLAFASYSTYIPNTKVTDFFLVAMYTSCTLQLFVQLNFIFKMIRFSLSHFKISCPGHSHDLEGPPEGGEDEDPVSTLSRPKGSAIRINTLPFH